MVRLFPYFFIMVMIIGAILRVTAGYLEWKFWKYIRKNYPEKEREFGCAKRGWRNEFALVRALYKDHGIEDAEFIRLKAKTRLAWTGMLLFIGAVVGVLILYSAALLTIRS
jgi:nitrate reductase gamma subunit